MKVLLISSLPPIYTGQSVSFKMLTDAISKIANSRIVNLSGKNVGSNSGHASLARALDYFHILLEFFKNIILPTDVVYLTIAQSGQGFSRDFIFINISKLLGRKVVVHLKGGNYDNFYYRQNAFFKTVIRWTLGKVDRILVLGEKLRGMYDFEPKLVNKIFVVENGLPFHPSIQVHTKTIVHASEIHLLYLSNLIESKGYLDVLDALAELKRHDLKYNVICHFAGAFMLNDDDKHIKSIEHAKQLFYSKIENYKLTENVIFHGTVKGNAKEELLQKAHVFILPTNYNNEGQPVSIIEALAYAIPIIATNYRAIGDMLIDGETGYFVPYGEPKAIASKLSKLLESEDAYTEFSTNARKLFDAKFTTQKHLERIYPQILNW